MIPKGICPITCPVGGMDQGAPWLKVPHSPLYRIFAQIHIPKPNTHIYENDFQLNIFVVSEKCQNSFIPLSTGCYLKLPRRYDIIGAREACGMLKSKVLTIDTQQEFNALLASYLNVCK